MHPKTVVMIPTYNEAANIGALIDEILALNKDIEIVVVDDDSPDGTWRVVQEKAASNNRVHLLHRKADRGRGTAGIAGFRYTLELGADFIVEMDGDFSHQPRFIPALLAAAKRADVVLGSRYSTEGCDQRGVIRRFISKCAGSYIRIILGYKVKDPTSGYRCFSRKILEQIGLDTLEAKDPFIVTEILYKCYCRGAVISEVPIVFKDREQGTSKLGPGTLLSNLVKVIALRKRESPDGTRIGEGKSC